MKLQAYRWRSSCRIEALGELARDALIGNIKLSTHQETAFRRGGATVVDIEDPAEIVEREFLLFADNVYVSWPLLKRFLRAVRQETSPGAYQLVVPNNALTQLTSFAEEQPEVDLPESRRGRAYRVYFIRLASTDSVLSALERARPVVCEPWIKSVTVPFSSRVPTMSDLAVPITDGVILELSSWVHVWLANLCFIGVWLIGLARSPGSLAWLLSRSVLGAATALSLRPYRMLAGAAGKVVRRGRGCRIHPSAVVEASMLGRNVEIGPLCVVRGSILGDNVQVMEQSVVDASVLGDRVIINQQGMIKACVAFPDAVFSWLQAGLVGERAFLGRLCRPLDMKYQGTVRVQHRGKLVDTGLPFLGCCIGHRAFISADSRILPGRAIPNDYKILSDFTSYIDQVPGDLPTDWLLLERHGKLEPFIPAKPFRGQNLAPGGSAPPPGAPAVRPRFAADVRREPPAPGP